MRNLKPVLQRALYSAGTILALLILVALVSRSGFRTSASNEVLRMGTGSVAGLYFPLGGAIAEIVNQKKEAYGFWVAPESTGGSAENINRVLRGDLEFGLAQADTLYAAYHGKGEWLSGGPQKKLRAIVSLHEEALCLVVSAESGIKTVSDLEEKRIFLGEEGSGTLALAKDALIQAGTDAAKLRAEIGSADVAAKRFQRGELDGLFYAGGIPNDIVAAALRRKGSRLLALPLDPGQHRPFPYLITAEVGAVQFPALTGRPSVNTIAVRAVLFTKASTDDRQANAFAMHLFQKVGDLSKMHPGFAGLSKQSLLEAIPIPLHEGAIRYFAQANIALPPVPNE